MSDHGVEERAVATAEAVLEARGLVLRPGAAPIDFTLLPGEVVGLAGLDGHGQELFLEVLCGLRRPLAGQVVVRAKSGLKVRITNFHEAVRAGIAYVPRDRKTQGILPTLTILDNFAIATLDQDSQLGFVSPGKQRKRFARFVDRLGIVMSDPSAAITSLSGGNQQKVLLARWMATNPSVMLLNDPNRGVDLATKMALYDLFKTMTDDGVALVFLSTEIEEILRITDRAIVFREGQVFSELSRKEITMAKIIAAMFGRRDGW